MVRLYRTFSIYIVTGETRSAGCLCKSSGWFKHIEPPRTYSNHIITEIARCGEVCHRVVRLYRTFPRYIATGETRSAGCLCNSSGWFKHIEPHRTYSNHNITELARCGEVCHMSSMCLNHPELVLKHPAHLVSQRTSSNLHEPQHHRNRKVCRGLSHEFGVVRLYRTFSHGAYALVQGGSSTRC